MFYYILYLSVSIGLYTSPPRQVHRRTFLQFILYTRRDYNHFGHKRSDMTKKSRTAYVAQCDKNFSVSRMLLFAEFGANVIEKAFDVRLFAMVGRHIIYLVFQ